MDSPEEKPNERSGEEDKVDPQVGEQERGVDSDPGRIPGRPRAKVQGQGMGVALKGEGKGKSAFWAQRKKRKVQQEVAVHWGV